MAEVSIPNGMEFYYAVFRINVRQRRVSIPNGMEFYNMLLLTAMDTIDSFNSQRDGILHNQSYQRAYTYNRFNSQRDGILRLISPL